MPVAYTENETRKLLADFKAGKTIEELCVKYNRTRPSIIAKLARIGAYVGKGYLDKRGEKPETKLQIVAELAEYLEFETTDLLGLDNAPKGVLKKIRDRLYRYDRDPS